MKGEIPEQALDENMDPLPKELLGENIPVFRKPCGVCGQWFPVNCQIRG